MSEHAEAGRQDGDATADGHREAADRFGRCVDGVADWDAPTPVAAWRARDVVAHLVTWSRGFLAAGSHVALAEVPDPDREPAAAWRAHAAEVQRLLDDPAVAGSRFRDPPGGELTLAVAIERFYTPDVVMHTWDLARASGQDDRLDPGLCAQLLAGMEPLDAALRGSGHYGPRLEPAPDAGPQDRLLAFIGRDVRWTPPGDDVGAGATAPRAPAR